MPVVPGVTAVCAALRPPPTPAQNDAFETVSLSAVSPSCAPPTIGKRSSEKSPAAATKPLPMSIPSVPETLRSVAPERSRLKLVPRVPSIVSADQSSGVGVTPPVALFTLTRRFET